MSMSVPAAIGTVPDVVRSGTGVATLTTWHVGTPERQREAVAAVTAAWRDRPWPDEGLTGYAVLVGEDGDTLRHYVRWSDGAAPARYRDSAAAGRAARTAEVDAAVPGIERLGGGMYVPHLSLGPAPGAPEPGCVVLVEVEFDGPDPDRAREWIAAVEDALRTTPVPAPGGVSAHFHVSPDGGRVLNLAEWESARAHRAALAAPGEGVGSPTPQWRRVHGFPGVAGSTVTRYAPGVVLVPGA
ncbi:antibiotic biosynthesis monooxygenase [Streptomyces sp. DW26H14]|uniref:antibiotic biosynthesis monooxygenase n=1 Tax=Streptomyces sp. DW26H14 TaxID=3435395 RepID=UPI00403D587C